jgi:ABC-2 type transport system permease protein
MRFELLKLWRSRRPVLALLSIALFLALMLFGFYTYAHSKTGGEVEFHYTFENRSYFNGLTFAIYAFYFGFLLVLPIFVATEGAAQLAGETGDGTLLLLLTRPRSRTRLFFEKLAVAAVAAAALCAALLLLALGAGLAFVGWGDLDLYPGVLQLADRPQHLPQRTALLRFALAWPVASLALLGPLALSMLVSASMRGAVSAVGVAVALYLVLYVAAEVHFFHRLRPWLFTSAMACWRELFRETVDLGQLGREMARLLGYTCVLLAAACFRFRTREER